MALRLLYLIALRMFGLIALLARSQASKDVTASTHGASPPGRRSPAARVLSEYEAHSAAGNIPEQR